MSNHHYEKWAFKTPLGFILIAGGIVFMYYSISHLQGKEKWVLYGSISGIAIALGAFLLSSAAINKVKSDLIKKQKIRQMSG